MHCGAAGDGPGVAPALSPLTPLPTLPLGTHPKQRFKNNEGYPPPVWLGFTPAVRAAAAQVPAAPALAVNAEYLATILNALTEVKAAFLNKLKCNVMDLLPLPLVGAQNGWVNAPGFVAPFDEDVYCAQRQLSIEQDSAMNYTCGVNLFHQDLLASVLSHVPLYIERVQEWADLITPTCLGTNHVFLANFDRQIPVGALVRLSADPYSHAVLLKVHRCLPTATKEQLREWLRVLLSVPATFKRLAGDMVFAEANSLRNDAATHAKFVVLTPRQMVFNVAGFKAKKEQETNKEFGAEAISAFWKAAVRRAEGMPEMNKSSIDMCLTLDKRLLSLPQASAVIARSESQGREEWNTLYKLQELVSRCRTPLTIVWTLEMIEDQLSIGKLTSQEIILTKLKSGTQSITDPIIMQQKLHTYLLGKWLDNLSFRPEVKAKAREVFASVGSYRRLYNGLPTSPVVDTTWTASWQDVEKKLLNFIEKVVFMSSTHDDALFRQGIRQGSDPDEVLAWKPWCDEIATLRTQLLVTVADNDMPEPRNPATTAGATEGPAAETDVGEDDAEDEMLTYLHNYCDGVKRKLSCYVVQPENQTGIAEIVKVSPLANVKPSAASGNVMILWDTNVWGESDCKPRNRVVAVSGKVFQVVNRGLLAGRCGTAEPDSLPVGELFVTINAGKDRKRIATKDLKCPATGGNGKTATEVKTLFFEEQSWRDRKGGAKRNRGRAFLTQHVYLSANVNTFKQLSNARFESCPGSVRSDVVGPMKVKPLSDIPHLSPEEKQMYYGPRRVEAGGPDKAADSTSENADDEEEEEVDNPSSMPLFLPRTSIFIVC